MDSVYAERKGPISSQKITQVLGHDIALNCQIALRFGSRRRGDQCVGQLRCLLALDAMTGWCVNYHSGQRMRMVMAVIGATPASHIVARPRRFQFAREVYRNEPTEVPSHIRDVFERSSCSGA
jgi:hypothetical protein